MSTARKHNRRLGLCAADLVVVRFKVDEIKIMAEIQDEVEAVLDADGFLSNAPFEWITISLRFGLKNEEAPHYQRINKKYGDLPMAIEVDAQVLQDADYEEFKRLLSIATLKALVHAGHKYELPHDAIHERLQIMVT